jgi:tetratricopeptide (TPR) repeat protein
VPGRTSVFALKGKDLDARTIGDTLRVATVLEGSVRRTGGRLRVGAQLVSATDNSVLWSETYDRELADLFQIQDELARAIVGALRVELKLPDTDREGTALVAPPTEDLEAHDLYLRGRFLWNQRTYESLLKAASFFERAIQRDSTYAQAYAGLADTYLILSAFGPVRPTEAIPKAKAAALRALILDSSLAEAHTSLGYARMLGEYDWQGAEAEFRRAIALNPNYATAHHRYADYLLARGQLEDALAAFERAHALDPLSRIISAEMGAALAYAHRYDDALRQLRATLELDPNFAVTHFWLCWVYVWKRLPREAIPACERSVALSGRNLGLDGLAAAYAGSGDTAKAAAIVRELEARSRREHVSPATIARARMGLGDTARAFAWLDRAVAARDLHLTEHSFAPIWDPVRADPRFARLLERLRRP